MMPTNEELNEFVNAQWDVWAPTADELDHMFGDEECAACKIDWSKDNEKPAQ